MDFRRAKLRMPFRAVANTVAVVVACTLPSMGCQTRPAEISDDALAACKIPTGEQAKGMSREQLLVAYRTAKAANDLVVAAGALDKPVADRCTNLWAAQTGYFGLLLGLGVP